MGLLVIMPFGFLAAWIIYRIFAWLRRGDFGPERLRVFGIFALAGMSLGIWFALFTNYHVANVHLEGFPIPVAIASREKPDDPWVNAVMPLPVRAGAALTDLLYGVVICLVPIALTAFIRENRGTKDFSGPAKGDRP